MVKQQPQLIITGVLPSPAVRDALIQLAEALAGTHDAYSKETRFHLTGFGLSLAVIADKGPTILRVADSDASVSTETALVPQWDAESRVLFLGEQIVKRYKRPSPNQDRVLSAFEEEGWPSHVYDPLPPKEKVAGKQCLHATIDWLNRNQENKLLRFRGDGTGEGICWERVNTGMIATSASTAKKLRSAA